MSVLRKTDIETNLASGIVAGEFVMIAGYEY